MKTKRQHHTEVKGCDRDQGWGSAAVSILCHQGNLKGLMPAHLQVEFVKEETVNEAHLHSSRQLFSRRHLWPRRLRHNCNYDESSQLRWSRKITWKENKTIQRGKITDYRENIKQQISQRTPLLSKTTASSTVCTSRTFGFYWSVCVGNVSFLIFLNALVPL